MRSRPHCRSSSGTRGSRAHPRLVPGEMYVEDRGAVSTDTRGPGQGGSLHIAGAFDDNGEVSRRSEAVTLIGGDLGATTVSTQTFPEAPADLTGGGGTLRIAADRLQLLDGGQLSASASGAGDAGDLHLAGGDVLIRGLDPALGQNPSGVFAQSLGQLSNAGDGGNIRIEADSLEIGSDGCVSAETRGPGDAGTVTIEVGELVVDGGEISAESQSAGNAGDVSIDAGRVFSSRGSAVRTDANDPDAEPGDDPFGNIEIAADELIYLEDSEVTTSVGAGEGRGGDIAIDPRFVVLNRSLVQANAQRGDAGNISIESGRFFQSTTSLVEATNDLGVQGEINTGSPDTDLIGQLARLPADYLEVASLLTNQCAARTARSGNFVVQGRDAIPPPPDAPLPSFYPGSRSPEPLGPDHSPCTP